MPLEGRGRLKRPNAMTQARSPQTLARTLLIDADDTLWEGSIYYLECSHRFRVYMATFGCDPDEALRELRAAELEAVPDFGYGPPGFCHGLEVACQRLLTRISRPAGPDELAAARAFGEPMLEAPMVLLPDVRPTLQALRPSSWLLLLTKGSPTVQRGKIERSALAPLFDTIRIEQEKDAAVYHRLMDEFGLDPENSWMIGNSPRSDINAANAAGLRAIHIPHAATWMGEPEEIQQPARVATLHRFADLPAFFGVTSQAGKQ